MLTETLRSTTACSPAFDLERRFAAALPPVRLDAEQIRRVIINLVDNAIEALAARRERPRPARARRASRSRPSTIRRTPSCASSWPTTARAMPAADREKLFMPYYSTKRRGSGLGLAIVRRIVAEHGGSIEVSDNVPHGSRFTIELPC